MTFRVRFGVQLVVQQGHQSVVVTQRAIALYPGDPNYYTVAADAAMEAARAADRVRDGGGPLGPLHGVPVAIKDLTATQGIRTTFGCGRFKDYVPVADEACVQKLRQAGAIILGKTNTPEFGFGAVCDNDLCGPTANPWNETLTSGGSSGGAAVAVTAGLAFLAHGTDFGGSVRTPASFCGCVGLRHERVCV